ncbi:MAG TPA: NAD(P)-binding domain-containing protein [Xanthobacteraceae bacterium]|jgi:pyrroline-5-carboxylate reductase|nr:NAD(P)-binding domain-containing protein [Xanthobacteraceae bacterium]
MVDSQAQYGFIGVGAIAAAMVTGLCRSDDEAPTILLSPRNAQKASELASRFRPVTVAPDNQAVIEGSKVIVLCLRPQDAASVLPGLTFPSGQAVVSAMAGVSLAALARLGIPKRNTARSIPLPAVARGEAATPVYPLTDAAQRLFDQLGSAEALPDETAFDALSASTATIATHFAYLEIIAGWLRQKRVPEDIIRRQLGTTFSGIATELAEPRDFRSLAQDYATAGGINAQFLASMKEAGLVHHVEAALEEVLERLTD